ncbi:hypothetical protein [Catenuloplanes atrovinosus]|uniref:Uncharacterized protein YukE n=1 Tax=Catenuloplanes atrovinosus TaxID=137266 RepID=A0AAE4CBF6_9ACTN|nr:hypothetical protein [Catenuloplanes atrovinosus]MDR7275565.1 uncharacterized protein YukE [Catenuloplanes atrovinosus]
MTEGASESAAVRETAASGRTSDRYEVSVPEVLRVVEQLGGLTTDIGGAIRQLSTLASPAAGYGVLGNTAGTAAGTAQQQLAATLAAMQAVLKLLTTRVRDSARAYAEGDRKVAEEYARTVAELPAIPAVRR